MLREEEKESPQADNSSHFTGFFPDKNSKVTILPQDIRRAKQLWEVLHDKGELDKKSKLSKWYIEFAELRSNQSEEEIDEILREYIPLISPTMHTPDEGCIPVAKSAKTFCDKYINIRTQLACRRKKLEKSSQKSEEEGCKHLRKFLHNLAVSDGEAEGYEVYWNGVVTYPSGDGRRKQAELSNFGGPSSVLVYTRFLARKTNGMKTVLSRAPEDQKEALVKEAEKYEFTDD